MDTPAVVNPVAAVLSLTPSDIISLATAGLSSPNPGSYLTLQVANIGIEMASITSNFELNGGDDKIDYVEPTGTKTRRVAGLP